MNPLQPKRRLPMLHQEMRRFRSSSEERPPASPPSLRIEHTVSRELTEQVTGRRMLTGDLDPKNTTSLPDLVRGSIETVANRTIRETHTQSVTATGMEAIRAITAPPVPRSGWSTRVRNHTDIFMQAFITQARMEPTVPWAIHYAQALEENELNPYRLRWLVLPEHGRYPEDPIRDMKQLIVEKSRTLIRVSNRHDPIAAPDLLSACRSEHDFLQHKKTRKGKPTRRDFLNLVAWKVGYAQTPQTITLLDPLADLPEADRNEFFTAYLSYRQTKI